MNLSNIKNQIISKSEKFLEGDKSNDVEDKHIFSVNNNKQMCDKFKKFNINLIKEL